MQKVKRSAAASSQRAKRRSAKWPSQLRLRCHCGTRHAQGPCRNGGARIPFTARSRRSGVRPERRRRRAGTELRLMQHTSFLKGQVANPNTRPRVFFPQRGSRCSGRAVALRRRCRADTRSRLNSFTVQDSSTACPRCPPIRPPHPRPSVLEPPAHHVTARGLGAGPLQWFGALSDTGDKRTGASPLQFQTDSLICCPCSWEAVSHPTTEPHPSAT